MAGIRQAVGTKRRKLSFTGPAIFFIMMEEKPPAAANQEVDMELFISDKKGVPIQEGMIGLFFEDINYAADGGLYAEMIENRSFEFLDCYGTVGDYYTKLDSGYGWSATKEHGDRKSVV